MGYNSVAESMVLSSFV